MHNKGVLYDTFNAKYLTLQEVASSFIPNDEYQQLIGNNHTLLMGPRGCGKTTLLKMITTTALEYWDDPMSEIIKQQIPFIAIYVPTDIQWKRQLEYLQKHLPSSSDFNEKITEFLILTNTQIQLCRTFQSLIRRASLDKEAKLHLEDEICTNLITLWNIEMVFSASFDDIEIGLLNRVDLLNQTIEKSIREKKTDQLFSDLPKYIYASFLSSIQQACKLADRHTELNTKTRWALCFDELELAPKFFQNRLYTYLRSVDQTFLFKLTTTPIVNVEDYIIEASQDNDFKTLRLWVYDDTGSVKWEKFCERLISERLKRKLEQPNIDLKEIFEKYDLTEIIKDELDIKGNYPEGAYKGSLDSLLFKSLAEKDDSFKEFLVKRKINPDEPIAKKAIENKSVFQKHKINVLYRHIYRNSRRKTPTINYGVPHIFDLADGNPRSIIGIIDDMLINLTKKQGEKYVVPKGKQTETVFVASKKYFNLIKNHPDSTLVINGKQHNLANDVIKKIGRYIYKRLVDKSFDPTLPTTFTVPKDIDPKILKLLEHALYLGAIVYLDPIESLAKNGLIDKRFRLSYLLTPLFRLPPQVNSVISINTILNDNDTQLGFEFENYNE